MYRLYVTAGCPEGQSADSGILEPDGSSLLCHQLHVDVSLQHSADPDSAVPHPEA